MDKFLPLIQKIISSKLLIDDLYFIPLSGASDEQIRVTEKELNFPLSEEFKEFLKLWNGANLDVVRVYGCNKIDASIPTLKDTQNGYIARGYLIIGSDPAGFLFAQNKLGEIFSIDMEGEEIQKVAKNFEDFLCDYIFGQRAESFAGKEWKDELIKAGIISI
jgi:hypothetical protein